MNTTALTTATQALSAASLAVDETGRRLREAVNNHLGYAAVRTAREKFQEALAVEKAARAEADHQFYLRHDLHTVDDGCLLCEDRPYDLHSKDATDAEREWAAGMHADSAMMLGVAA